MINGLNTQFGTRNVQFYIGEGELVFVKITNNSATAEISLHGAHVTSFMSKGKRETIWVSKECIFKEGTAIRGGIPVCWPWFGAHPSDSSKPSHGFVRNRYWNVKSVEESGNETVITFFLKDDETTRAFWDYAFEVNLEVKISDKLEVNLISKNLDNKPFTVGGALHSYFPVSEVSDISIQGLENVTYVDALQEMKEVKQNGAIIFAEEVDRVYIETPDTCEIVDPAFNDLIKVSKSGSQSTVIWNPWIEKAKRLPGYGDEEYHNMVCIETTNALKDVYEVQSGESHTMTQVVELV